MSIYWLLPGKRLFGSLDEGHQRSQGRRLFQEVVLQQLRGGRPLLHGHVQALAQKVFECVRELLWMLQLWRAVCRNEVQSLGIDTKKVIGHELLDQRA